MKAPKSFEVNFGADGARSEATSLLGQLWVSLNTHPTGGPSNLSRHPELFDGFPGPPVPVYPFWGMHRYAGAFEKAIWSEVRSLPLRIQCWCTCASWRWLCKMRISAFEGRLKNVEAPCSVYSEWVTFPQKSRNFV